VGVSQISGELTELPANWARSDDGQLCLICRREQAAETALEKAPDGDHKSRAQLRRSAILEFELLREPERSNAEIAKACRATAPAVAKVREQLGVPEAAPPSAGARAARSRTASRR
jgi:hypothetical protein